MRIMTHDLAKQFAQSTLGHVGREYPNGLSLYLEVPTMVTPSGLHPIFFGSFDWHSCVHGWWQLLRIARLFPDLAPPILERATAVFTPSNAQGELEYVRKNTGFERPYGWAWFLMLHCEAVKLGVPWEPLIEPIARLFSERLKEYLPRLTYPIRAGTHANTAFALILALQWADLYDPQLKSVINHWAAERFKNDTSAAHQEPSGEDFLSPTLTEALLMSKVALDSGFQDWLAVFMPELPPNLMNIVTVSDRSDGRIGHLDGLHLSRAWCWRNLAAKTPASRVRMLDAADLHFEEAMPHLRANYMSEHWLCSFALLALTDIP